MRQREPQILNTLALGLLTRAKPPIMLSAFRWPAKLKNIKREASIYGNGTLKPIADKHRTRSIDDRFRNHGFKLLDTMRGQRFAVMFKDRRTT